MNVLFTCAGRRTYLLRYFRSELEKFYPGSKIFATDMQLTAPALTVADVPVKVPSVYDENYVDITLDICKTNAIELLISLNDLELPLLSRSRSLFEAVGTQVLVSSSEVIDICFDKYKTAQFVSSLGLLGPLTFINLNEAKVAIKEGRLVFPIVLKPRWGSGSIGIEFVNNLDELEEVYSLLSEKIKTSILSKASVNGECILIQEKIEGPEYGIDVMNNLDGEFQAVSVKRKLAMRAGETDKAITIDNASIREIGKILGENLKHVGNLDCDVLERDGKYYVLELNPRFGGGYPFSHEAGVNMPLAILSWVKGKYVNPGKLLLPRYGECYAKCDYLVRVDEK